MDNGNSKGKQMDGGNSKGKQMDDGNSNATRFFLERNGYSKGKGASWCFP